VISGFRLEVDENIALLGSYEASSGKSLLTSQYKLSVRSSNSTHKKPRAAWRWPRTEAETCRSNN